MVRKIIKIDVSINDVNDINPKKISWASYNKIFYISHISEFTIEEKARLWWNWHNSREYARHCLKRKYL